ncbi:MAG: rhodanese-like domain-containing protein, partial [Deltaproteobacteria bacterium]|nr:rhodanese-like domain-containing protein [Deltaproteobacteria bacterium]
MIKKGKRLAWAVLLALVALAPIALGAEVAPVVDSAWVKANGCNKEVVVLDLRDPATYAKGHIPCAIQTDYAKDGWRVDRNGVVEV